MSINRDIQIKEIKSMHKAVHGEFPYHLDFNEMDDDEVDKMFNDLSTQLYSKPEQEEEDWRQYLSTEQPKNSKLSSCFVCG